jgi:hypothetical protein
MYGVASLFCLVRIFSSFLLILRPVCSFQPQSARKSISELFESDNSSPPLHSRFYPYESTKLVEEVKEEPEEEDKRPSASPRITVNDRMFVLIFCCFCLLAFNSLFSPA